MSSIQVPKFTLATPTKEKLDYIELVNLDMSKYDNPATRQELANELYEGVTKRGFLTLSNHGISQELMESQADLAHAVMTLPPDEKAPFEATPEEDAKGRYVGFKPAGVLGSKGGFHKTLDHYNILTWDPEDHKHLEILAQHIEETRETIAIIRAQLLQKLLHLVAMVLEVPKERVLETHAFGVKSTEYLRYRLGRDKPLDDVVYNMSDYLNARKHGYKRLDLDHDRPRGEDHQDPFDGKYEDPAGFKSVHNITVPTVSPAIAV